MTLNKQLFFQEANFQPSEPLLFKWCSAHTSEFDDIFRDGGFHPGCATIAAALAVAQHHKQAGLVFCEQLSQGMRSVAV